MLQKSKALFETWNSNSLSYCHWKGNDHLMEGLDGATDLDVLLDRKDKEIGTEILNSLRFSRCLSQYGFRYPNIEDWIGFDEETGKLIHLHLHFALMTGHAGMKEYELPWTDESLKTRVKDEETGVYIMNPNLELISLYTRLILKSEREWIRAAKKKRFKLNSHFQKEINYIKDRIDWEEVTKIAKRYYGLDQESFIRIVKEDNLSSSDFLNLRSIVNKAFSNSSRYHNLVLWLGKLYWPNIILFRHVMRKRFGRLFITKKVNNPNKGFSIAFIGQDGSGKSTVTEEIKQWLNWKIDAERFYLGSGDHYKGTLKQLLSVGSKVKHGFEKQTSDYSNDSNTITKTNKQKKNSIKTTVLSIIGAQNFLNVARHAYRTIKRAERYRLKGGIPLYDRFPQIQYAGIYDGPKIEEEIKSGVMNFLFVNRMAKRERAFIEKIQSYEPDIVFKLLLTPEESIRRKPFENYDDVKKKHEITKQLIFPDSQVYEVDAAQNYQEEIIFIKNKIWQKIIQNQSL